MKPAVIAALLTYAVAASACHSDLLPAVGDALQAMRESYAAGCDPAKRKIAHDKFNIAVRKYKIANGEAQDLAAFADAGVAE